MKTISTVAWISRRAGGLQESVRRIHQSLNEMPGVNVSVAALQDKYSVQEVEEWRPLPVSLSRVFGPPAFGYSPDFFQKILQADADILHSNGLWQYPTLAVNRWHKTTGRPYLVSPHGMLDPWAVRNSNWKKRIAYACYERRHLEGASCIRALCAPEAQAIRNFGLRNPICIIPNGIDLPETGSRKPETVNSPWSGSIQPGQKVLLYLGRIHPKKGLVNLIRAWAARRPSDWALAIAGWDQGGHEIELKRLCTELGISFTDSTLAIANSQSPNSVMFLGSQFGAAKAACYASCDAFILPSFSEGLPMVILEAWSHGKPVIMTPECNLPEGFAADAGVKVSADLEGISDGLDRLSAMSVSELNQMGQNGRHLTAENFQWKRMAGQLHAVCRWITQGGARPDCVFMD